MPLKYVVILYLFIFQIQKVHAGRAPQIEWWSNNYVLHQNLNLSNKILDSNWLYNKIHKKLISDNFILDYDKDLSAFILLSRVDSQKCLSLSNEIITKLSDDEYLYELAAQYLAKNGKIKSLNEIMIETYFYSNIVAMAQSGDYSYSNYLFEEDTIDETIHRYAPSLAVFIGDKSPYIIQIRKKIINDLNSTNHNNFLYAFELISTYSNLRTKVIIKKVNNALYNMLQSMSRPTNYAAIKYSIEFSNLGILDNKVKEIIIQKSLSETDYPIVNKFRRTANSLLLLSIENIEKENRDKVHLSPIIITDAWTPEETIESYLSHLKYSELWRFYLKGLNNAELLKTLERMEVDLNKNNNIKDVIELNQKITYLRNLPSTKNNYFLKLQFTKVAIAAGSPVAFELLTELYSSSDNLQKNALIARFPIKLSTETVKTLNENNPWIKLANLTNLLTICGVEVPAIEIELSDTEKLTKYLEEGNELLKGCTRLGGRQ